MGKSSDVLRLPSLKRYLLRWAMGAVVLVWLVTGLLAWWTAYHEIDEEIPDGQLISVGRGVLFAPWPKEDAPISVTEEAHRVEHEEYALDLAYVQWRDGQVVRDSHGMVDRLGLRPDMALGLQDMHWRSPGTGRDVLYRMYMTRGQDALGQVRAVAVLLDTQHGYEVGYEIASHVVEPAVLLFPLVAALLWWAMGRGLRPLDRLSSRIAALNLRSGERLETGEAFSEFASTVHAINSLVDSLQEQAERERAFASDVAHELRTPLSAIALQARAAKQNPTPEQLEVLQQQSLRAGRILQQLLDLARAQRSSEDSREEADLGAIAVALLSDIAPKDMASGHDLSLESPEAPVKVAAPPLLVELAMRNLIDNAVRHTPQGTQVRVDIWQDDGSTHVTVSDDGQRGQDAHIPASDRAERGGLGLGLRLVERLADACGAQLRRDTGQPPMTTRFWLSWPGR
ncbi:ATP-binding protein [Hydrogenophaga sp. 5NK40-0174]|uniref:sensor histidine kinase n=1 Tax=Hydrogenophaga sp. 5NK40-0174 TaxID=3127649 RepID=UPI0031089A28